jgi:hypothetical protein
MAPAVVFNFSVAKPAETSFRRYDAAKNQPLMKTPVSST